MLNDETGLRNKDAAERGAPIYERMKEQIRSKIETGEWPVNYRVPSENQLVDALGVSRMTANRALRELASEGVITRVQGKGSFVAEKKRITPALGVRNIAEEILERGAVHRTELQLAQIEVCGHDLAASLELDVGAHSFHTVIVHHEDDVPIQLEDRFVNPSMAADYMAQDFTRITPNAFLTSIAPITKTEQFIEAVLPQPWECKLLAIARSEPCILIRRRTWSDGEIVTSVRLLYPGTRYRLKSDF